jgi:protein ImuB
MKNAVLKRRYLALFLPWLSSERAKREAPVTEPFALIEKRRGAMRLVAVSVEARSLGLTPGLALADARALVPDLVTLAHDPDADAALLNWLAHGCERYTPSVALDAPHGLVLDIAGCTHAFRGERGLRADLETRLTRLGLTAQLACADTPEAARALAEFGGKDIHALPIGALRVAPEVHIALRRAGLKTLGDLAIRPRAPLAARFGADFPSLLARTLGEEDVHITPRRAPPLILAELRFAEPIAHTGAVLDTLGQLATEVAITLTERSAGGRQFALSLFRSDGHVARLGIETGAPTRDPALLIRLFRERVDSLNDPLDPGFGYDVIRLSVFGLEQLGAAQLPLEGGTVSHEELGALIDRLGVRLGRNRLKRFVAGDSHIPEQAALALPVDAPKALTIWPEPLPSEPPLRPLHLFDPPQRIDVTAEVPDGPPRRFRWRTKLHEVVRYEGPERIASEWWQRKKGYLPGQAGLTRDYYRVEDARGRRFWVFRHGLYGAEKANPDWYLHGLFA